MNRRATFTAVMLLLMGISTVVLAQRSPTIAYQVIVNPNNAAVVLDRKFVEEAFLKRTTRWPSDEVIHPVDLEPRSIVRRRFSEEVLNRSVEAIKEYWQQRIFSGRDLPPPELDADSDVVQFVLKHDGAIGYVSGGADLRGSKVVGIR